jgi:hypothetical protein
LILRGEFYGTDIRNFNGIDNDRLFEHLNVQLAARRQPRKDRRGATFADRERIRGRRDLKYYRSMINSYPDPIP